MMATVSVGGEVCPYASKPAVAFYYRSPVIKSVVCQQRRTPVSTALNFVAGREVNFSTWKTRDNETYGVGRSSSRKTHWRVTASGKEHPTEYEASVSNGKVEMLEEEIVDGCTLRHGNLTAKGVKIHFVECGDPAGKLVILVHGWPNFWYVWKNQFKALAEAGCHVIALDLRGYNTSSKPGTVEAFVRSEILSDLVRFIDHFGGGQPAVMVGHDWGSTISWCLAEDYPNKVSKLITVNMGRLSDFSRILSTNYRQTLLSWYILFFQVPYISEATISFGRCAAVKKILRTSVQNMTEDDIERHVVAFSHPGAIQGSLSYYRAAIRGLWHRQDGKVPIVKIPVTVIWGEKDNFLLPVVAETSKATAPNSRVVHLSNCAHWPMWDDPTSFNEVLLKSIAEEVS